MSLNSCFISLCLLSILYKANYNEACFGDLGLDITAKLIGFIAVLYGNMAVMLFHFTHTFSTFYLKEEACRENTTQEQQLKIYMIDILLLFLTLR